MAFKRTGTLNPHGAPVKISKVIKNSITVTEMDSVKLSGGVVALGTTGALVFGHVLAIGTENGVGLETTGATGAETGSYINTFTTASNNETVGFVKAEIDISKQTLYSAEVDATIGTTTGSNLSGYFMDLVDEDTLDESTAAATVAQYATHGVDKVSTGRAVVNIYESQVL